jgi:hypothetical protein
VLLAAAVWLRQLLNDLRAEIGEPPIEHYNVLRATRQVREDLGVSAALSFEGGEYMDQNSQMRPMIRFSDDVLFPVVAAVGGKVESRLLHNANVQYNRLKRGERSRGFGSGDFRQAAPDDRILSEAGRVPSLMQFR